MIPWPRLGMNRVMMMGFGHFCCSVDWVGCYSDMFYYNINQRLPLQKVNLLNCKPQLFNPSPNNHPNPNPNRANPNHPSRSEVCFLTLVQLTTKATALLTVMATVGTVVTVVTVGMVGMVDTVVLGTVAMVVTQQTL